MVVTKGISFLKLVKWTGLQFLLLLIFMGGIAALYHFEIIRFSMPWLPVSIIGTAVAFYVGFKNNQAYGRMWEARKIWGGIVNDSRSWGMMVDGYISNQFADSPKTKAEIHEIKQRLIYRHIAWLYAHRSQLLVATSWEHIGQGGLTSRVYAYTQKTLGVGLIDDEITRTELKMFLPEDEYERLIACQNTATQIINEQSRDLARLRELNVIDDFRHTQMEDVLRSFYTLQGKNERIKKFPLPRQYAHMSRLFVGIFIALLPFGMLPEFMKIGELGLWLSVPISALVGWVYVMMEMVGDISENPFQGLPNDIPMMSLCRVIEIDLREMLGETDLPPKVQAKKGI
ncbi:MAG: bestrophin family ion channel, partial [Bacteroidota bacterium]